MPVAPFPLREFMADPLHPATVDIRAVKGTWPAADVPVVADFTECDFEGYRRLVGDIWDVREAVVAGGRLTSQVLALQKLGPGVSNDVAGYIVVGTFEGNEYLLASRQFPAARTINDVGDGFTVQVDLDLSQITLT